MSSKGFEKPSTSFRPAHLRALLLKSCGSFPSTISQLLTLYRCAISTLQHVVLARVRQWLGQNSKWLLVLDNVNPYTINQDTSEDGYQIDNILKELPHNGHILLTTRSDTLGALAESVPVRVMDTQDGAKFLLRRLKLLEHDDDLTEADPDDLHNAKVLVKMLGGLPLALEQGAAYIQETRCGIAKYYEHYQSEGKRLRNTRGRFLTGTQATVATTWSLSFQAVEQASPVAAELLRALAFLAPGTIPEEIISEGASRLGDTLGKMSSLDFDEAIGVLLRYSLVQRNERTQFLIIHQLVQKVLKDDMSDGEQRIWAERVVRAINSVFPDGSIATWQRCQNCQQRGKTCSIAEPLYLRALEINVKTLGHNHPYTARTLSNLAELYFNQGRYDEAEKRTEQAFAIRNRIGGPSPTDVAQSLYDIARMHYARGHNELAELFYQYTLALDERALGLADPRTVMVMKRYAILLHKMNRDADATALEARVEEVTCRGRDPEYVFLKHEHNASSFPA